MAISERLSLGPIGTNCYLVRAAEDARDVVVIDPSGPADELLPELERRGLRCGAILVTHGHFDHILGVADLAEASGAEVTMPEGERFLLQSPDGFTPPGITVRPWSPEVGVIGGETLERCDLRFEVVSVPGHSPAHVAYAVDGELSRVTCSFAGLSAAPTFRAVTGQRCSRRSRPSSSASPLIRPSFPGTASRRRSAPSSRPTRSSGRSESAASLGR